MSWEPFGHRTMFVRPFRMGGETASGILVQHHEKLPVIYARVTAVHPTCRNVRVGDWVIHEPNRTERLTTADGPIYVLDERLLLGVVEPGDGDPWFREELVVGSQSGG